ncbi:hypothetical protein HanRHA438_Chr01g0039321 [Helianthus annuus]|nr:hypothetical protein HanRHA438_Chr01g0039321 [Helianthus annuus]
MIDSLWTPWSARVRPSASSFSLNISLCWSHGIPTRFCIFDCTFSVVSEDSTSRVMVFPFRVLINIRINPGDARITVSVDSFLIL